MTSGDGGAASPLAPRSPGTPTSSSSPIGCRSTWSGSPTAPPRGSAAPAAWSPPWSPCCADGAGRWVGWPGIADDATTEPIVEDDLHVAARPAVGRRRRPVLRGLLQRHAVAAVPRRHRQADLPPRVVGHATSTSTGGSPRPTARAAAKGATVWVQDYQLQLVPKMLRDAAARPDHRLLPAHPVPARRAVHADAVAHRDHRGAARRRPGRLPSARRRAELPVPGAAARRCQHLTRPRSACGRGSARSRSASAPSGSARSRSRSTPPNSTARPATADVRQRAREIRAELGNPREDPARRRPAGLHQGHRRPARGASRSCSTRAAPTATTPCWCSWPRPAGNASRATSRCARTSSARSATSTASTARSAIRWCTTCTSRCRARS